MSMFSLKNLGVAGIVVAALVAFFTGDWKSLFSMFTNEAKANEKPAPVPIATPAAAAATPVTAPNTVATPAAAPANQTPAPEQPAGPTAREKAALLMADWNQRMVSQNTSESVRQAILSREPFLMQQFEQTISTTQNEQLLNDKLTAIQIAALTDATKPQFDAFVRKAERQIAEQMDEMMKIVGQNADLPIAEKNKALKVLQAEKEGLLNELKTQIKEMPEDQRILRAMKPELQNSVLQQHAEQLNARREEVTKNVSSIARENNGLAWGGSALGWTSAGLAAGSIVAGLAGVAAAPVTGGLSLGVTLAAATAVTGIAAGACKTINHNVKGGSNFQFGMGIAEMGLNALPLGGIAANRLMLGMESAAAASRASGGFFGKTGAWMSSLSGASVAEGQAMTAVTKAEDSLRVILKSKNMVFPPSDIAAAQDIMKNIVTGAATVSEVAQGGNLTTKVVLKSAENGASHTIKKGVGLVGQAITEYKAYDPLVGNSTTLWRGAKQFGYTTADSGVDSLMPSKTPENAATSSKGPTKPLAI